MLGYWLDEPNRRVVAEIEKLSGCYAGTNGTLMTGKVDHVYINYKATDDDVL